MTLAETRPVDPGAPERCTGELHPAYLEMPDAFRMGQGSRSLVEGTREWDQDLLVEQLRDAARTRDPRVILQRAAVEYVQAAHGPANADPARRRAAVAMANATADLAVTGRAAYRNFRDAGGGAGIQASEISLETVRTQAEAAGGLGDVTDAQVRAAIDRALDRAYDVAWAIRGPTAHRSASRPNLGWLAVSGIDDPPHRPVNVPSAPVPQHEVVVTVPAPRRSAELVVPARYVIFADGLEEPSWTFDRRRPPPDAPTVVPGDHDVLLFIHGHSSRAEEASDLAPRLVDRAREQGRRLAVIAVDLPCNGYSGTIDHERVAPSADSAYNTGYPVLDFIEEFIVQFVERLGARGIMDPSGMAGVIGGSLGGNMALRLSRRDFGRFPWLAQAVAWSPASTWGRSWAHESLVSDLPKHESVRVTRDRMSEAPAGSVTQRLDKRREYFDQVFHPGAVERVFGALTGSPASQPDRWYSPEWPCRDAYQRGAYLDRHEIYNDPFRRWHWRVAHEQLIFMHEEPVRPGGPSGPSQIRSRLLLAAGSHDDHVPDRLYSNTRRLAGMLENATGTTLWLERTGHSIHNERPDLFSRAIIDFLEFPSLLAEASWAHVHEVAVEHPDRLASRRHTGVHASFVGRPGERTWLHFAVPTPVIVRNRRLRVGSVLLRFRRRGPGVRVGSVHVYDGEVRIAAHAGRDPAPGNWHVERYEVGADPEIRWGLGVSVELVFGNDATAAEGRQVDFSSVGCDFLR